MIIEPKQEPRSIKPLLLGLGVIVGLVALLFGLYLLLRGPSRKTVVLKGEDAKKAEASADVTQGPPMPAAPPLPQAQDPGATMVTLDLKNVTVHDALLALSKKTNVDLLDPNENQNPGFLAQLMAQRFNLSVTNQPFWMALREICKQGKMSPNIDYQSRNRITLVNGERSEINCPTIAIGSCLLVLRSVTSTFDADLVNVTRAPGRSLNVEMVLFVEPKISPYRISRVATIETATDEKGNSLVGRRDYWSDRNGGGNNSSWTSELNANLTYPANPGDRITKLKGYASVTTAGKDETVTIADPLNAKNVDKKIDPTTVRLMSLRKTGNQYEARMAGDANSPVFKDWDRFSKIATLTDASGKKYTHSGGWWGGMNRGMFEFGLTFNPPEGGGGEPKEMQITLPSNIKEIRVPFEFSDLPLPH